MMRRKRRGALPEGHGGLTTAEFALLLALLVVAAIAVWTAVGNHVNRQVNDVSANQLIVVDNTADNVISVANEDTTSSTKEVPAAHGGKK